MKIVAKTDISAYPLLFRGKVRDIYEIDERTLLVVTTDRMSAFDVVLDQIVPWKGVVLNQITLFWMKKFESAVPNHVMESDVNYFPKELDPWKDELEGRSVIVRKAAPLPIECIVRGYLTGSGLKAYQKTGEICGIKLPKGLEEASRIEPAIFTPTTKAEAGKHDENISLAEAAALAGDETAMNARLISLDLYNAGAAEALKRGIIIADTKFEFGYIDGVLHLIDEVLTPDSSRFWSSSQWRPGRAQPGFDKQFLRDWLSSQNWNHQPPPPAVPDDVIKATANRYREIYEILLGKNFPA